MAQSALIGTNSIVIDIRPTGEEFPAANEWRACGDEVAIGWLYDSELDSYSPPE